jgi:hypothetical protein
MVRAMVTTTTRAQFLAYSKCCAANAELNQWSVVYQPARTRKELIMPFLIPVLVGIPVLFGGGYVIYHFVH